MGLSATFDVSVSITALKFRSTFQPTCTFALHGVAMKKNASGEKTSFDFTPKA